MPSPVRRPEGRAAERGSPDSEHIHKVIVMINTISQNNMDLYCVDIIQIHCVITVITDAGSMSKGFTLFTVRTVIATFT